MNKFVSNQHTIELDENHIYFVDVKGVKTPMYKIKKWLVENEFPIKILEV